jgi:hypothetical protein
MGFKTMPMLKPLTGIRTAAVPVEEPSDLFASADLSGRYFPSRTFFCSVVCHLIAFALVIILSIYRHIPEPPSVVEHITYIDLRIPTIVFLPTMISPVSPAQSAPEPEKPSPPKKSAKPKGVNTKGLSYPGPQTIVSDPPNPTNRIQTLLQPDLKKPAIFVPPVPLPNIVQVVDLTPIKLNIPKPPEPPKEVQPPAEPKPESAPKPPPPKAPEPKMVLPALDLAPPVRMEKPKVMLPPSIPPLIQAKPSEKPERIELPDLIKASSLPPPPEPEPETKPAEAQKKEPEPAKAQAAPKVEEIPTEAAQAESMAAAGSKDLLSLSPMPAPALDAVKIPAAEARGRFAISPEPSLSTSEKTPGAKEGISSEAIGIGNKKIDPAADEPIPKIPVVSSGVVSIGARKGTGGDGQGSGSGSGKGKTKKPFAGITIVGGAAEQAENSDYPPITQVPEPIQTSYGLKIISTENSGGGLPFFGVFSHDQIYTTYLDMREVENDQNPRWILEFQAIPGPGTQASAYGGTGRNQQGFILPIPTEKVPPAFPENIMLQHLKEMVIVYGVVNVEGRLEQLSVKDSPDALLNEPLIKALKQWIFKPGELAGQTVATKLLMGVPLWFSQQ